MDTLFFRNQLGPIQFFPAQTTVKKRASVNQSMIDNQLVGRSFLRSNQFQILTTANLFYLVPNFLKSQPVDPAVQVITIDIRVGHDPTDVLDVFRLFAFTEEI